MKYYFPLLILFASCTSFQSKNQTPIENTSPTTVPISIHSYKFIGSDGDTIELKSFAGKKILFVNTASECGYTPQYEELQKLYSTYTEKLVVVGIPSNNFGGQEPGTNKEIKTFCQKNYGVTFPISEKQSASGEDMSPIFKFLTSKELNGVSDASIKWNFTKFLIDENGFWMASFPSSVKPLSTEITGKI